MQKIIAIGGGGYRQPASRKLLDELIRLTGKRRPRVLLIPTATHDRPEVCQGVLGAFGRLGCAGEAMLLLKDPPSAARRREMVLGADLIFVSGGNTLKLMRRWRHLGVDRLLAAARGRGTVLSGSSAGGICWCDFGHSDSMADYHPDDWEYIRVRGLGWVPVTFCPHYSEEGRQEDFGAMIRRMGGLGIAADEFCALEVLGDRYRFFSARRTAHAYRVTRRQGEVLVERLPVNGPLAPLSALAGC